jgi:hypothetical protein
MIQLGLTIAGVTAAIVMTVMAAEVCSRQDSTSCR